MTDAAAAPAPEEAERAIQRFVDAFNEGDPDETLSAATSDLVVSTAREWPDGGVLEGTDAVRSFLAEFSDTWERIRYERLAGEWIDGLVVERARWVGAGATTGIEGTVDFYVAWTVAEGLVARMDAFARRDQARAFARSRAKP